MKQTRMISKVLAVILSLSLVGSMAFAYDWDLEQGSITVDTAGETQMVSQDGGETKEDASPVIIQSHSDTATQHTITVTGDKTADLTIQDVNIHTANGSAIDVQGNTTANITAEGKNTAVTSDVDGAGIHVGAGNLNLHTAAGNSVHAGSGANGAAIGSCNGENMSGSIRFSGEGSVEAVSADPGYNWPMANGAAIGSGYEGSVSGSIDTGDTNVNAISKGFGAGIGGGHHGDITETGSVTTGSGEVNAQSMRSGAGIGTGESGNMLGTIQLGSGKVTATSGCSQVSNSGYGAGIGGGYSGDVSGKIITGSGEVNATAMGNGAGIGTGSDAQMDGDIILGSGNVTAISKGAGAGMGSGKRGNFSGRIQFGSGNVQTQSQGGGDAIGHGQDGNCKESAAVTIPKGTSVNGKTVNDSSDIQEIMPDVSQDKIEMTAPVQKPAAPAAAPEQTVSAYWTLSEGIPVRTQETRQGDVITLTMDAENGELHMTGYGLKQLQSQGIKTVVFKTASAESRFEIESVLDCTNLVLTHKGGHAELTLDGAVSDKLK